MPPAGTAHRRIVVDVLLVVAACARAVASKVLPQPRASPRATTALWGSERRRGARARGRLRTWRVLEQVQLGEVDKLDVGAEGEAERVDRLFNDRDWMVTSRRIVTMVHDR